MTLRLFFIWQETHDNFKCLCIHNDQPRWGLRQGLWWSGFYEFCNTSSDKLFLLGVFNARAGTDYQTCEGAIGTKGVGECNNNGLLLFKAPYSSKSSHSIIQERFDKLIYSINTIIKCGIWQPVKFQLVSRFWTGSKQKWFFLLFVGNINSEIR